MAFNHLLLLLALMPFLAFTVNAHFRMPTTSHEKSTVKSIGVQGMIYCHSGSKRTPIKGAMARVTCTEVNKHGLVTATFTVMSDTDRSGYFLATMTPRELKEVGNITDCKAYLHMSPYMTCNIPTNVNDGITGATLTGPRLSNKMHLYSVKYFEYAEVFG